MIHLTDDLIRANLLSGTFGLERESLRVLPDGTFSQTPHPFPVEGPIVRDYCENQTEINTSPKNSVTETVEELKEVDRSLKQTLAGLPVPELLWPFSNPPYIRSESDIPVANFEGALRSKTLYRDYLSGKYGSYKMTFSGIHFNFSFSEELLRREFELLGGEDYYHFKDAFYLNLARGLVEYGWLLTILTAASPLLDRSFLERGATGETVFTGMSSYRCSEFGYWNDFVPVLDYSDLPTYSDSIQAYIDRGLLTAPSELYYPIRLKSKGENNLDALAERGVSHIELRMIDLNPLVEWGVEEKDLLFAHLLMVWLASKDNPELTEKDQVRAVANFKRAARYDLTTVNYLTRGGAAVSMAIAGKELLEQLHAELPELPPQYEEAFLFELQKFTDPSSRYAPQIAQHFQKDFVGEGLKLAAERQVL